LCGVDRKGAREASLPVRNMFTHIQTLTYLLTYSALHIISTDVNSIQRFPATFTLSSFRSNGMSLEINLHGSLASRLSRSLKVIENDTVRSGT